MTTVIPMTHTTVIAMNAQARYAPSVVFRAPSFVGVAGLSADMISAARSATGGSPSSVMGEVCRLPNTDRTCRCSLPGGRLVQ